MVSTDVGDVAERLADDPHSFVCRTETELVDRLVETLSRGGRSRGREAIDDVTLDRMAARIHEVYRDVLPGGRGDGRTEVEGREPA